MQIFCEATLYAIEEYKLIRYVVLVNLMLLMMLFISNCNVKMLKHEAEFYGITPLGEYVCTRVCVCMCVCVCVL